MDIDVYKRQTVDLIVTSPPYPMIEMWDEIMAMQNPTISNALSNNPTLAFELMHQELDKVWAECYRVIKDGGLMLSLIHIWIPRKQNRRHAGDAPTDRRIHAAGRPSGRLAQPCLPDSLPPLRATDADARRRILRSSKRYAIPKQTIGLLLHVGA